MPAKKRNEPRYKSFLGRIFTLRNHKNIPASRERNGKRFKMKPEQLGEAVLVLDESNARVRVCAAEGGSAWIAKFYLHKEINNGEFLNLDAVTETIEEMLSLAEDIQLEASQINEEGHCSKETLEGYSEQLYRLANSLRHYADLVSPTSRVKNNGKK